MAQTEIRASDLGYWNAYTYPEFPTKDVATGKSDPAGRKAAVKHKVPVRAQRQGPETGDLSNSQYAALGLRACHDAGIILPQDLLERASKSWRDSQNGLRGAKKGRAVTTGPAPVMDPRGWGYNRKFDEDESSTGSMTAGAVGAIAVYDRLLGVEAARDEDLQAGVSWLVRNFSVQANPRSQGWHFYYLYALERAGIFLGTERFGTHEWYPEGAKLILEKQAEDGGWWSGGWQPGQDLYEPGHVWETCFAILFLRRAARPLKDVASSDRFHPSQGK